MTVVVCVVVVAVLVVLTVLAAAVVELFRDVEFLRSMMGMTDQPLVLNIGDSVGQLPSFFGLPKDLDSVPRGAVIILAEICATCSQLLDELAPAPPENVVVIVSARSPEGCDAWLADHGVLSGWAWVLCDVAGELSERLQISTSPSLVTIVDGRVVSAQTLPSVTSLRSALADLVSSQPSVPSKL